MYNNTNAEKSGDDLLSLFANFDVKLKKLKPNVVRSWFDTTGTDTQKLLNWLTEPYLTESNYLSSVYRYEFQKIDQPLDLQKCNEELAKLDPSYTEVFQSNHDTLSCLRNDIATLEKEEQFLSEMIELSKSVNHQLSLDYTFTTKTEIQLQVECETRQSDCENLSKELDEVHQKLSWSNFIEHDGDVYLVDVIDAKIFQFDYVFNLNSPSSSTLDETMLNSPEDYSSEVLEVYKSRVFRSCQLYLKREFEIEQLKQKLDYLSTFSVNESLSLSCGNLQIASKDFVERNLCQTVEKIAKVAAEQCLKNTLHQYNKRELEAHQLEFAKKQNSLDLLTELLSYYALTLCLQLIKIGKIEHLSNFYRNLREYVEKKLLSCRTRTEQMKRRIEQRQLNLAKPEMEKHKFVATLGKILNVDNCTLTSVAEAVRQLERQLNLTQNEVMCFSFEKKCPQMDENITVLTEFLTSGPTNKIALIRNEVRAVCYLLDEELKKTSEKVRNLTQGVKTMSSTSKKYDKYSRLLWMNFLTNPSKVEEIIKEAENDFNNRNKHYF